MARLLLLTGGESKAFELDVNEVVVGRLPECEIHLDSNMISRKHARLRRNGSTIVLEDLGSGNGTFVNGQRISGAVTLQHDDRVKFGPLLTRFEADQPAAKSRPLAPLEDEPAVEIGNDDAGATIMGAAPASAGFGLLDVQPEAKLKGILEISRSLAGTVSIEKMLPRILDSLFSIFPGADRGCILLKNESDGKMVPRAMKHRRGDSDETVKLSRTVLQAVMDEKKAILSADAGSDARFQAAESISSLSIRSMMCVPLLSLANEVMGVIHIDTQNPLATFRKDDLEILLAVAGQAALSYESARLLASYVEKQKQDSEMNIAAGVQRALLPDCYPSIPGYAFYAAYEAAQAVGGDYYDIIPLAGGKICLAFGDVAGKGVPASLVMSRLSSAVRTTVEFVTQPDLAVARINNHMCAKAVEGRFVTFVLIILDTINHTISLANAGHMSPMVRKIDGSIEEFDDKAVGVPLGVIEDMDYTLLERPILPGESVVVYTDGVSEAMNYDSDLYSIERLKKVVSASSADVVELGNTIRSDVRKHANGRPQNDDITLMVFGRLQGDATTDVMPTRT
ncbi:Phosphoserine phosphatase RsbU [Caulifigura coniformis]|uniref:Phosphoserine phosphatase RsbU n=1 Tax=Caulifigura coniformis TaxID=2527983 RepID=A0A517SL21_9PLAN|nr:SpoIIE family protein phosphatase [Caulifigura coniformis]QDT56816.1 Phosphoserine phosphatase RsbU [Caulifigura coniformis]